MIKREDMRMDLASALAEVELPMADFRLPPPPALVAAQAQVASLEAMDRMFSVIDSFEKTNLIARKTKLGVNRLAASTWDREGWIAMLIRLATRGGAGNSAGAEGSTPLADAVREKLYKYVITEFRSRMDVAVAWLNEEWYSGKVAGGDAYKIWMMKVMDGIFPYLEAKDRLFMRMLSEVPEIPRELMDRIKTLCLDPDRMNLGISMLQ